MNSREAAPSHTRIICDDDTRDIYGHCIVIYRNRLPEQAVDSDDPAANSKDAIFNSHKTTPTIQKKISPDCISAAKNRSALLYELPYRYHHEAWL